MTNSWQSIVSFINTWQNSWQNIANVTHTWGNSGQNIANGKQMGNSSNIHFFLRVLCMCDIQNEFVEL